MQKRKTTVSTSLVFARVVNLHNETIRLSKTSLIPKWALIRAHFLQQRSQNKVNIGNRFNWQPKFFQGNIKRGELFQQPTIGVTKCAGIATSLQSELNSNGHTSIQGSLSGSLRTITAFLAQQVHERA